MKNTNTKLQEMYKSNNRGYNNLEEYTNFHKDNLKTFNQFEANEKSFDEYINGLHEAMTINLEEKAQANEDKENYTYLYEEVLADDTLGRFEKEIAIKKIYNKNKVQDKAYEEAFKVARKEARRGRRQPIGLDNTVTGPVYDNDDNPTYYNH